MVVELPGKGLVTRPINSETVIGRDDSQLATGWGEAQTITAPYTLSLAGASRSQEYWDCLVLGLWTQVGLLLKFLPEERLNIVSLSFGPNDRQITPQFCQSSL